MEAWAPGHRPPAKLVDFLENAHQAREAARLAQQGPQPTTPWETRSFSARPSSATTVSGASSSHWLSFTGRLACQWWVGVGVGLTTIQAHIQTAICTLLAFRWAFGEAQLSERPIQLFTRKAQALNTVPIIDARDRSRVSQDNTDSDACTRLGDRCLALAHKQWGVLRGVECCILNLFSSFCILPPSPGGGARIPRRLTANSPNHGPAVHRPASGGTGQVLVPQKGQVHHFRTAISCWRARGISTRTISTTIWRWQTS
eukprot:6186865-Pleurochrysis_carterae.AAC.4